MRIEITAQGRDGLCPLASALLMEGGFFHALCPIRSPGRLPRHLSRHDNTITALSDACREWVEENVEIEAWQRFGNSIAIEPRYVDHLAEAMIEEGLVMEIDDPMEQD